MFNNRDFIKDYQKMLRSSRATVGCMNVSTMVGRCQLGGALSRDGWLITYDGGRLVEIQSPYGFTSFRLNGASFGLRETYQIGDSNEYFVWDARSLTLYIKKKEWATEKIYVKGGYVLNEAIGDEKKISEQDKSQKENQEMKKLIKDLQQKVSTVDSLYSKINQLESMVKSTPKLDIKDYVEQSVLDKIYGLQENPNQTVATCCVCLENVKIVSIKCKHELCNNCIGSLKNNLCPICRQPIERISTRKPIAVFTKINLNAIGVFYLPPMNNGLTCTEHEVFTGIAKNPEELRKFLSVCDRITKESYLVVQNGNILDEWKKFNAVKELKFVEI
jgi:hypothetical protein